MRLSTDQIEAIKQETGHFFGADARVWLFGSRVDDTARGGDYVQSGVSDKIHWPVGPRFIGRFVDNNRAMNCAPTRVLCPNDRQE